jgi:hypothetical protein
MISEFIDTFRRLASAFFRADVALRRQSGQVRVVFEERAARIKDEREVRARRGPSEELMQIRAELAALLNEKPQTRKAMRHLAFVEHALGKKGLKVLGKLPLELLKTAHGQLEDLVVNWSPQGLANLRSKMAVAIIEREQLAPGAAGLDSLQEEDLPEDLRSAAPAAQDLPADALDSQALAAAYAALGQAAPTAVELQGELGSRSAREKGWLPPQPDPNDQPQISIRVLQP